MLSLELTACLTFIFPFTTIIFTGFFFGFNDFISIPNAAIIGIYESTLVVAYMFTKYMEYQTKFYEFDIPQLLIDLIGHPITFLAISTSSAFINWCILLFADIHAMTVAWLLNSIIVSMFLAINVLAYKKSEVLPQPSTPLI